MCGPMVGITDEELFDIAEAVHQALWRDGAASPVRCSHAKTWKLTSGAVGTDDAAAPSRPCGATTPRILLAEAIEKGFLQTIKAKRSEPAGSRRL